MYPKNTIPKAHPCGGYGVNIPSSPRMEAPFDKVDPFKNLCDRGAFV